MFYDDYDGKNNEFLSRKYSWNFLGIILVSDLTSRQSFDNLKEWLYEVIRFRSRQKL